MTKDPLLKDGESDLWLPEYTTIYVFLQWTARFDIWIENWTSLHVQKYQQTPNNNMFFKIELRVLLSIVEIEIWEQ
jgi:hypothetical protein